MSAILWAGAGGIVVAVIVAIRDGIRNHLARRREGPP